MLAVYGGENLVICISQLHIFGNVTEGITVELAHILIDYLNGIDAAREEICRYETPLISTITWMEVMVGVNDDEQQAIRSFLSRFTQVSIDKEIAEIAVSIRRRHKMRLPDAIIWASAKRESALLVSRNTKDFPADSPGVRAPYQV